MIIKRVSMNNIRSYRKASIELPLGRTLFEGDVGSGKSTILMAIEFAFFGLGSESGASLLRMGESSGSVSMIFEVDGNDYEVVRGLERKGGRVQQTEGLLSSPEGEVHLSPTELKEKMLEVLQFNEVPDPKAQSRIYRYAVYTPQEEMKTILSLSGDLRLQILRRALNIEDYKVAAENTIELVHKIREEVRELEGRSAGLDELRKSLAGLGRQKEEETASLGRLLREEATASQVLESLREEREKLRDHEVELNKLANEVSLQRSKAVESESALREAEETVSDLEQRKRKRMRRAGGTSKTPLTTRKTEEELRDEVRSLEEKSKRLTALLARVEVKIDEFESMTKDGVCPVCERPVKDHEFAEKRRTKQTEREHASKELGACEAELKQTRELADAVKEHQLLKAREDELAEDLARYDQEIQKCQEKIAKGRSDFQKATEKAEALEKQVAKLADVSKKLRELGGRLAPAEERLKMSSELVSRTRERMKKVGEDEIATAKEIQDKEAAVSARDRLKELEVWLTDYFVASLQQVEKNVMLASNQEFNALFQKWFATLVSDPEKEVRVDENFTPIVTQDGYEQEVRYLSGGEKTTVSLAYRLSLNTLVQRTSIGMKSNLLILDEPTDGFSKEQLGNVREVLDEIACPQVIVVSHEKELESFADQTYRVVKENGLSSVLPVGG